MGEVYRARDMTLKREVAIKVLPEELAADPDRLARLEREAHLLAALNHPNIATIHSLEHSGGTRFLVLELVKGESLEQRLAKGPLPTKTALDLCKQIAEALEAAHGEGIIHRDLKPANVLVTPDGRAKVLDFGLAKSFVAEASDGDVTHSPTLTVAGTQTGVIIGTAPYMSPEQVRGKAVDERADIWAFGCLLYEVLTGRRAFDRETVADTLAAIIEVEPNWGALPAATPPLVGALVKRCLRKDPDRRVHDIADARIEIEEALSEPAGRHPGIAEAVVAPRVVSWVTVGLVFVVTAVTVGLAVWGATRTAPPAPGALVRFRVELPSGVQFPGDGNELVLSPDGNSVVFLVGDSGSSRLFLQRLDQLEAVPIPGTEGAKRPFFSPDSEWVAFNADGNLKRVALAGGEPFNVCEDCAYPGSSGAWHGETIVFMMNYALWEIPATGGVSPVLVAEPNTERGETRYNRPDFLPNGKAVVFELRRNGTATTDADIALLDLETKDVIILAEEGTDPQYLSSGHVLYARESTLFSLRLDADQLQPVGQPTPVEQQVLRYSGGSSQFSVSSNGVFAHIPTSVDSDENRALIWVDTNGDEEYVGAGYGAYQWLSISPDGVKIAATRYGVEPSRDVWIWDTESLSTDRRTFGEDDFAPVWSVDGSTFAFASGRSDAADRDIYVAPQNGSAEATVLYAGEEALYPVSRAPDGSIVVLRRRGDFASDDLLLLDAEGQSLEVIVATEFDEANASLSPDGQWLAYTSNESGQEQVIVRHFPGPSGRWAVSPPGGTIPNWSPNGLVVYYDYLTFRSKPFVILGFRRPLLSETTAKLLRSGVA